MAGGDYTGTNKEKIDKLVEDVIGLKTWVHIVTAIGCVIAILVAASWRLQSNQISNLERSVGELVGSMNSVVKPFQDTVKDISDTTKAASENITDVVKRLEAISSESDAIKAASENITDVVKRLEAISSESEATKDALENITEIVKHLETISSETQEWSGTIALDDRNFKFDGQTFQISMSYPEGIDPAKVRKIRVQSVNIPDVLRNKLWFNARPEGESYLIQILVSSIEGIEIRNSVNSAIRSDSFLVEIVFISNTD